MMQLCVQKTPAITTYPGSIELSHPDPSQSPHCGWTSPWGSPDDCKINLSNNQQDTLKKQGLYSKSWWVPEMTRFISKVVGRWKERTWSCGSVVIEVKGGVACDFMGLLFISEVKR